MEKDEYCKKIAELEHDNELLRNENRRIIRKLRHQEQQMKNLDRIVKAHTNIGYIIEAEEARRVRVEVEEDYRRQREYVMKEMHDGLGSILTNIIVASRIASSTLESDTEKAKKMVDVITSCSVQATEFLRTGLTILDSEEGEVGTLVKKMRHWLGGMLRECGIAANFEVPEEVEGMKTDAVTGINIVRCFQEAFNNILKHSGAKEVSVRFMKDGDKLAIEIEDDGKGFEYPSPSTRGGYGIMNMAKRMEGIGGKVEINSSPGMGTTVTLTIPKKSPGVVMEREDGRG